MEFHNQPTCKITWENLPKIDPTKFGRVFFSVWQQKDTIEKFKFIEELHETKKSKGTKENYRFKEYCKKFIYGENYIDQEEELEILHIFLQFQMKYLIP